VETTSQAEAIRITEVILGTFRSGRWAKYKEIGYVTDDGFAIIVNEDYRFTFGFGVLRELTPTTELLKRIDAYNKLANVGHVWLAENYDDVWCLVWGEKMVLDHLNGDSYGRNLANPLMMYDELLPQVQAYFEGFDAQPYWTTRSLAPADAWRIISHIH
jgi:hypothetical protein